jgi:hypothetical protein
VCSSDLMLALLWGLNRVMISEIFKCLHKSRMNSTVNYEVYSVRIERGDPKTATTLSTSTLGIVSASRSRIGMSFQYVDKCSLYEKMYLLPFSVNGSGPMQSILILSNLRMG